METNIKTKKEFAAMLKLADQLQEQISAAYCRGDHAEGERLEALDKAAEQEYHDALNAARDAGTWYPTQNES